MTGGTLPANFTSCKAVLLLSTGSLIMNRGPAARTRPVELECSCWTACGTGGCIYRAKRQAPSPAGPESSSVVTARLLEGTCAENSKAPAGMSGEAT